MNQNLDSAKKAYRAPTLSDLGAHGDVVATGGASRDDVDNFFYEDGRKFPQFGDDPAS